MKAIIVYYRKTVLYIDNSKVSTTSIKKSINIITINLKMFNK